MKTYLIASILLVSVLQSSAQTRPVKNLVFEGAGIRGIAYAGVIEELERQQLLQDVENVGGTSAGAITAMMLSLGYSSTEIADIISSTKFNKFNDGRFLFVGGLVRMNKAYGWYRGEKFRAWLSELIAQKTGDADITLAQLSAKGYKDLYITATCLNKQQLVVLSKETYPQMKVKDAVRISMSIPLYFRAVFVDAAGKTYTRPEVGQELDIMVDGGIIGNFPITMFDSVVTDPSGKQIRLANMQTLGIRIDSQEQIQNDASSQKLVPLKVENLNGFFSALYIMIIENLNRQELTQDDWARTISVSSVGISPKIKRLSKEQKNALVASGRSYTAKYLQHNYPTDRKP
ncbi:patatin-like phospholipase family protein [Pontibacter liquoris]|uniref:patatin-like phospholipase family protein n=1 Tax=Pontibacter liquoris TaxID=2905677 RepID=UPI001FA70BE5|nr:patatin-like phospholipase family protein [Pontibacter liquoris]